MRPALSELRRAQTLFEQQQMPQHALSALDSIAIIYNRMGDYAEAAHLYERALDAQHKAGLTREEAVTLHNLGRAHENLQEWDAARSELQPPRSSSEPPARLRARRGLCAARAGERRQRAGQSELPR
jgi:tetratricopeptide (TPR) repeat protein